jgi:hypothetical protein
MCYSGAQPQSIFSVSKARLPLLRTWVELVGITHSQCSLNAISGPTTARPSTSIQQVRSHADGVDRVLVSVGSYCIVFDTVVEDRP